MRPTKQTGKYAGCIIQHASYVRARVCACVRMRMHDEIRARTRAARTCTQACTRLAPAPAPSTRTPRRTPRPVAFTSCENFARVSSRSDTLLSPFFLSFFPSSFLSFFLPFPPRPCSIFYEAALPPFGNAISRKPPPDFPRLSLFLFSRFLFQRF